MKKIVLSVLLFANLTFGAIWSSSAQDGITQAFAEYDAKIRALNSQIIQNYNRILAQAEEIVKNCETKRRLLENQSELLKNGTLEQENINFNFKKLKLLLDNEATR